MAAIYRLPDELLDLILAAASTVDNRRVGYVGEIRDKPAAATLALVCRRFHRLAVAYLYETVHLGGRLSPEALRLLHGSMACNPALRPLVRGLAIYRTLGPDMTDMAADFVTWFFAVVTLEIELCETESASLLLDRALRYMVGLARLELRGTGSGIEGGLSAVMHTIGGIGRLERPLRTLALRSVCLDEETLKERATRAQFTELQLDRFREKPATLASLVRWPDRLKVLDLGYVVFEYDDNTNWNLAALHRILSPHKPTLCTVRIRNFIPSLSLPPDNNYNPDNFGLTNFNLHPFTSLTHLTLPRRLTGTDPSLVHQLLAPRLRVFCWDLTVERYWRRILKEADLQSAEGTWLRALAREAAARRASLRTVKIDYAGSDSHAPPHNGLVTAEMVAAEMLHEGVELWWDSAFLGMRSERLNGLNISALLTCELEAGGMDEETRTLIAAALTGN